MSLGRLLYFLLYVVFWERSTVLVRLRTCLRVLLSAYELFRGGTSTCWERLSKVAIFGLLSPPTFSLVEARVVLNLLGSLLFVVVKHCVWLSTGLETEGLRRSCAGL